MIRNILLLILSIFVLSCNTTNKEPRLIIFCAASLSPIVEQIKLHWEKDHAEKIIINSASSGVLARQIENGAQADVYLSANREWMNYLTASLKLKNHPKSIVTNRLVIISSLSSSYEATDMKGILDLLNKLNCKIAVGDPGHVPLGKYSKQCLDQLKVYEDLSSKLILTKDARSSLRLVELGEAELGFVYRSDAFTSTRVKIIAEIPEEFHSKIEYQGILLNESTSSQEFLNFLTSGENSDIWKSNGFGVD